MAIHDLSAEEVQCAIDAGYRTAGTIFRCFVEALEQAYGKDEAHHIADKVVQLKAKASGEVATRRFGRGGFRNLMEAQKAGFPNLEVLEITDTRYVIRDRQCPIVEGWRQSGLSAERIKELGDIYCLGDLYYAQVFHPDIRLEFESRIAEGEPCCQWAYCLETE